MKIDDLARTMVRLSGLEVRDENNPDGDIAIEYIGLRRGEKLYEELLIGENTTGTSHPRIFKNSEPVLAYADLVAALEHRRRHPAAGRGGAAGYAAHRRRLHAGIKRTSGFAHGRLAAGLARCIEAMLPAHLALAIAVVASAAALSALLIYLLRPVLIRHLLAHPNERSSHVRATPQGAGVGVMLALFLVAAAGWLMGRAWRGHGAALAALLAAAGLTVLGLADDAQALPVLALYRPDACRSCHSGEPAGGLRLFPDLLPLMVERRCSCSAPCGSSMP